MANSFKERLFIVGIIIFLRIAVGTLAYTQTRSERRVFLNRQPSGEIKGAIVVQQLNHFVSLVSDTEQNIGPLTKRIATDAAVSALRRVPHEGQMPRRLQLNTTSVSRARSSQVRRRNL